MKATLEKAFGYRGDNLHLPMAANAAIQSINALTPNPLAIAEREIEPRPFAPE